MTTTKTTVEARVHDLKVWPEYFAALEDGSKPFELRGNDRDYRVGDVLNLQEWEPSTKTYTGRELRRRVTYVMGTVEGGAWGLEAGWCVLGLAPAPSALAPAEPSSRIAELEGALKDAVARLDAIAAMVNGGGECEFDAYDIYTLAYSGNQRRALPPRLRTYVPPSTHTLEESVHG